YESDTAPTIEITATSTDGSSSKATFTINLTDATPPDAPVITNITDDSASSDYSTVTLHGTGEPGATITLWVIASSTTNGNETQTGQYTELESVTTTVSEDGTWTLDVSSLTDTPVNDNEFFKVTQTDAAGNTSADSNVAHYWHGTWSGIATEVGDDYVLTGSGNDQITIGTNDANDALTVDGGAGTDTVIFQNFDASQATFVVDDNGHLQITRGDTGDIVLLIDVENVKIGGNTYTIDQLFTPAVTILEDSNNDGILSASEDQGAMNLRISLPLGAKVGDTVEVFANDDDGSMFITVSSNDFANGYIDTSIFVDTADGSSIVISAKLSTGTQTGTDQVVVDATAQTANDSGVANEDTSVILNVLANDEAGSSVTSAQVDETKGSVVVNSDGTVTFTPAADVTGEVVISYSTVDAYGNIGTATATVSISPVNDAPELTLTDAVATVSEEGLEHANPDTTGTSDTTDATSFTGTFTVSDVDTDLSGLTVTLQAPTTNITSGGQAVTWATVNGALVGSADGSEVIKVEVTDLANGEGRYVVTLSGPVDHADSGEDVLSFDFGVTVSDGELSDSANVTVRVEDDAPVTATTMDTVELARSAVSQFSVTSIQGGFANNSFESSGYDVTEQKQTDDDLLIDQVKWNDNDGIATSLAVVDSGSLTSVDTNVTFAIGEFTHVNTPISTSYKSLETSTLTYELNVNIAGQDVPVTLTADLAYDATLNSNTSSADVVRLTNLSSTEVTVDGSVYKVSLAGFMDENGQISANLSTEENETSVASIAAKVEVVSDGYAAITGTVTLNEDAGADGGVVVADTISNDDGTLVINSDGSYSFTPSAAFGDGIGAGQSANAIFTYQVRDGDGDVVDNTLTITVEYPNSAPVANDDMPSTFAGLSGEYFGINEQIDNLADFEALIAGKQADATFVAANVNYNQGTGTVSQGTNLQNFLGSDAATLSTDPGNTSDGGIRLSGYVYLEAGTYNFKVYADDGYQIKVDGAAVATVTNNQTAKTTEHSTFVVAEDGYHSIEMLW
ncbi:beta strand repeat-containing protein, partial [Maribrevibacterium harenarium]|uniref:beta strand repeat-containing protein n=1 Tax=Maribrevibacterium harenarium TaxID=2589817 RepID=UPI0015E35D16